MSHNPPAPQLIVGGLELVYGPEIEDYLAYRSPTAVTTGYLLDDYVVAGMLKEINAIFDLHSLPTVLGSDVSLEHAQLGAVVDSLSLVRVAAGDDPQELRKRGYPILDDADLETLNDIVLRWRQVPNSAVRLWWNQSPYHFGIRAFAN